jgi:hypothetical protein
MKQHDIIVLVEGIMDVWSVGEHSGALFGNKLKVGQLDLLYSLVPRQPIVVLLLDRDASDEVAKARQQLSAAFPDRVVVATLPETVTQADCRVWPVGKIDPGVMQTDALDSLIQAAIRQQIADPS